MLQDRYLEPIVDERAARKVAQQKIWAVRRTADYREIADVDDVTLAKQWTEEIRVASIPLSVFCQAPFTGTRLRFCFAKDDATLEAAAERLCRL